MNWYSTPTTGASWLNHGQPPGFQDRRPFVALTDNNGYSMQTADLLLRQPHTCRTCGSQPGGTSSNDGQQWMEQVMGLIMQMITQLLALIQNRLPGSGAEDRPRILPATGGSSASGGTSASGTRYTQVGSWNGNADGRARTVMQRLQKDLGLTPQQAAGVAGNLYHESDGMKSNVNEYGRGTSGGYGWAQWTGGRRTAFMNFARNKGLEPGSPEANYQFLVHELRTTERRSLYALKKTRTAEEATISFRVNYERAGIPHDGRRVAHAERLLAQYRPGLA